MWGTGGSTFEKVDCKASFVNGSIGDELEPEPARRAFDVIRLLVTTVTPNEVAVLTVPITYFQVVIGTAVVTLNLGVRGFIRGRSSGFQGPHPQSLRGSGRPGDQHRHCRVDHRFCGYLKGLEREAHVETLRHLDTPDADFVGPVIVWVIG